MVVYVTIAFALTSSFTTNGSNGVWALQLLLLLTVTSKQTLCLHSPNGSTFLREMTSWPPSWNYDVLSEIRLRQSMHKIIYLRINPAIFHPDPIWNAPTRRTKRWV